MSRRASEIERRALAWRPVVAAWLLIIGVDLLFNAGLFMSVFDQEREPSLLDDDQLFRRVPVAYLALLAGVIALAWLFDRLGIADRRRGISFGLAAGALLSLMGVAYMWTAVEMTGLFVAAGSLVLVVEFSSAGWALSDFRRAADSSPMRTVLTVAILLAVAGIVIQNLQA